MVEQIGLVLAGIVLFSAGIVVLLIVGATFLPEDKSKTYIPLEGRILFWGIIGDSVVFSLAGLMMFHGLVNTHYGEFVLTENRLRWIVVSAAVAISAFGVPTALYKFWEGYLKDIIKELSKERRDLKAEIRSLEQEVNWLRRTR